MVEKEKKKSPPPATAIFAVGLGIFIFVMLGACIAETSHPIGTAIVKCIDDNQNQIMGLSCSRNVYDMSVTICCSKIVGILFLLIIISAVIRWLKN
jgi:hypothetical protein